MSNTTIQWFGATTYRLRTNGLNIFLDTWLDRPDVLPKYLVVDDVDEADYIFISHAHFDHLPGADRIALRTGAIVVANAEACNILSSAGVPSTQLLPVSGGERIPLFSRFDRLGAQNSTIRLAPGPPGAPARPHPHLAVMSVHVWPALHCLMPPGSHEDIPDIIDTGTKYHGAASEFTCTLEITFGMQHGLLRLGEFVPEAHQDEGTKSFLRYVSDRKRNVFSHCDGGQLAYNFLIGEGQTLLWSSHLGAYEGVWRGMRPRPDVAILGIAGRANADGRPWEGSAAEFARREVEWLGEPGRVIWCLHDQSPIKPYGIDTTVATRLVEKEMRSRVLELKHGEVTRLFE